MGDESKENVCKLKPDQNSSINLIKRKEYLSHTNPEKIKKVSY